MSQIVKSKKDVRTVTFPSTIREVLNGAFAETAMLSAILNDGLETLGVYQNDSFYGVFSDTRLRKAALPSTLQRLGSYAFARCKSLRDVTLEKENMLKNIGESAFLYCRSLKHIALPEGLEIIGKNAFKKSELRSIILPSTLKEVYDDAFNECA